MRAAELRTAVPAIVERNGYLSIVDEQVPVMYGFTWSNEQLTAVTVYLATELNFGDVQGHLEGTWGAPIAYETAHGGRFPIWRSDAVEAWLYTRPHGEATLEFRVPHPDAE